jgi:dynein heavy chain
MFGMEAPHNKELEVTLKELAALETTWGYADEWGLMWERWRNIRFTELSISTMQGDIEGFQKKVVKIGREAKQWGVWTQLKEKLDQFRVGLPLIEDLKNSALRRRHWDRMQEEVGKQFDYAGDSFNLDEIFTLGLDQHAELIATISVSATKEMAIENGLKEIGEKWNDLSFEMAPYKETHKITGCDDIFLVLEDNKVNLVDMRSSRYFFAFEAQVEYWEKTLSRVLETTEVLLAVQRVWMYLENIFVGSEDIRRQLPAESATFDKVSGGWRGVMEGMAKDPNALKICTADGLLDSLNDMNTKLEKIQNSLDQYLESKRRAFPRFYFLSDHDLLEVLGQAKDPYAVQKHLHNCFDNINSLEFTTQGKSEGRRRVEAVKMFSAEGEEVQLLQPVPCEGGVEIWLRSLEDMMVKTLNRELAIAVSGIEKFRKEKNAKNDKYLRTTPGQLVITASQIFWTMACERSLDSEKVNTKEVRRAQASILRKLSEMVRGPLSPLSRLKLVALLTVEIHQRDVTEKLVKAGVKNEDFEWKSQLRFYWEKDEDCHVRQTDFDFKYGYEYIGNTGRLVITSLTDRVYLALTTALMMKKGGNPQGPAGTGKTETVKDLGKALGKYVVVHNCSDKMDVNSMAKSLSGLAQTGSWACFDEFNRIETNVLSVIAVQIASILAAISEERTKFIFQGAEIALRQGSGIFVTMNPGYAGRSELPDNLKSQFRPVSMMVPDFAVIGEIILFSEGFTSTKTLSRKIVTLYQLCIEQLSRQDHYDFTLRSIKSVLVTAGSIHRKDTEMLEDLVVIKALKDMNIAKFVKEDVSLFLAILSDLFPGAEVPDNTGGVLLPVLEEEMLSQSLRPIPIHLHKCVQLFDTKVTRHGTMIVGGTGSGKSVVWNTLAGAMRRLARREPSNTAWANVKTVLLNPKAITLDELYGAFDTKTNEWKEGIFSTLLRDCSADTTADQKWIIFDGPVDTLWIESMNSVLDDNKILTPVNGERIFLKPLVSLIFEVQDLSQASPATVSRCGMIYIDTNEVGWRPYADSWIAKKEKELQGHLSALFAKHIQHVLDFRARECKELVPTTTLNAVVSLCKIFDALATKENGLDPADQDF